MPINFLKQCSAEVRLGFLGSFCLTPPSQRTPTQKTKNRDGIQNSGLYVIKDLLPPSFDYECCMPFCVCRIETMFVFVLKNYTCLRFHILFLDFWYGIYMVQFTLYLLCSG